MSSVADDPLTRHIEANRQMRNDFYADALEMIRDRLRGLEVHYRAPDQFIGHAWLIECSFEGGRPDYYCGPAMWCNNPHHAFKFPTKEAAEARSAEMKTIGTLRVADHSWT